MADLPIPFKPDMVRALLDGSKTMTRRIVKPHEPPAKAHSVVRSGLLFTPRYQVGDRLYVREHWRCGVSFDDMAPRDLTRSSAGQHLHFEADTPKGMRPCFPLGRHRQGMHMPRIFSRLTLLVTEVRVQQLQDISDIDARAEGIEPYSGVDADCHGYRDYASKEQHPRYWFPEKDSFRTLWDSINAGRNDGAYAWASNPWVTATTFSVQKINIDEVKR